MKKLTNTLYMIIAVLAIAASQTATAQIHTTSSATLAKEPTATMQNAASANVGHYNYKSGQTYNPTVGTASRTAAPVYKANAPKAVTPVRPGIITASSRGLVNINTAASAPAQLNSIGNIGAQSLNTGYYPDDDDVVPGGSGAGHYAGGVVPVGSTWALALLLLAYAAFIAVRKNRKEA